MDNQSPLVITISRQLGSGGAYVGQQLARKLNCLYADRDIISQSAKKLMVVEKDLEFREEKIMSFWESFLQLCSFGGADTYIPPQATRPSDREIYEAEASVIRRIAVEGGAVIVGRCGHHLLRSHPNHVSIFLHCCSDLRSKRVQELYDVSETAARSMIADSDQQRARYNQHFTGQEWNDSRQYDLALETSKTSLDEIIELIMAYIDSIR